MSDAALVVAGFALTMIVNAAVILRMLWRERTRGEGRRR
jgi:hypothetical protein